MIINTKFDIDQKVYNLFHGYRSKDGIMYDKFIVSDKKIIQSIVINKHNDGIITTYCLGDGYYVLGKDLFTNKRKAIIECNKRNGKKF